jgi:cholesterol transport system auxiliary component
MTIHPIARRLFIVGAASLALSACGGLIGPPEDGSIYVVRPVFPPAAQVPQAAKVSWSLALMRPDVPGGLDSDRVALVQPDGTMDFFAKATFPDRLPATVQRALLDGFEASGRIDAVAREEDALHSDYNLLIEVKDFSAHYATADGIPTVSVSLMARLTTAHGRKIVAAKPVLVTGTASANSAGAVVAALQQALGQAVTQVVTWTLESAPAVVPGQSVETASPGKPAEQLLHDVTRGSGKKAPQ